MSTLEIINKFSDPDLVPHVLLDTSLPKYKSTEQLPELQSSASQLLSQLDNHSQDITYQLESVLSDLIRAKSRLNYEIELLKTDVLSLSTTTTQEARPQIESASGSAKTAKVISKLEKLYKVKQNIQKTQQVFTEAKNFDETQITTTILSLIESGDKQTAFSKLNYYLELCQVWKGTTIYSQKIKFITGLRKRAEAIIMEKERPLTPSTPPLPNTSSSPQPPRSSTSSPATDSYYSLIGQFQKKIF